MQNQLCWAGHCIRMSDNRHMVHMVREHMVTRENISKTLLNITWRKAKLTLMPGNIYHATAKFETNRLLHKAEKRQRRKERRLNIFTSPSIWHRLPTLQHDLQIKNQAHESPQDTWPRPLEDIILILRDCWWWCQVLIYPVAQSKQKLWSGPWDTCYQVSKTPLKTYLTTLYHKWCIITIWKHTH